MEMNAVEALDRFLSLCNASLVERTTMRVKALRSLVRQNPWDPRFAEVDQVEDAVTITVPLEDLRRIVESTSASLHPAFEDEVSQKDRIHLYNRDDYFRDLVDQCNTYLFLRTG